MDLIIEQERVNRLLKESIDIVVKYGFKIGNISKNVNIENWTSIIGRCEKVEKKDYNFQISLSKYFLIETDKDIKNILIHEVIHTIEECFNHGKEFKRISKVINENTIYKIETFGSMQRPQKDFKYKITCNKCGTVRMRKNKSDFVKNPQNYCCGGCEEVGQFTVENIK